MELCWLYAMVFFLLYALGAGQFPFAGGLLSFWIAAILGFYMQGRGWRIIQVFGLQVAGFVTVLLGVIYTYGDWSYPFSSMVWLWEAAGEFQTPMGALILLIVASFAALFWFSGERFSRRLTSYSTITSRFDLGTGVFFFLFLLGGRLGEQAPEVTFLLFPFFLFSMLSIALARSRGSGKKEYFLGLGQISLVFLFCAVLLFSALGVVLLFLPGMTLLAETGYGLGSPLLTLLLKVLLFLFRGRSLREDSAVGSSESGSGSGIGEMIPEPEVYFWEKYFNLGIAVVLGAVALIAAGWGLYHLYRWLFSRTAYQKQEAIFWKSVYMHLAAFCKKCGDILLWFVKFCSPTDKRGEGSRGYKKLLLWGKRGGFPRVSTETAREYGSRLMKYFPLFKEEIMLIIEGYHHEVYGELKLDVELENRIKQARRRLSSPLHWPYRLKTRLYPVFKSRE